MGSVYLERVVDAEFQATHPVSLKPNAVARILNGVAIQDHKTAIQTLFAAKAAPTPAFSEEEINFLAPLLSDALNRATPHQRIGFRVNHAANPLIRPTNTGAGVGSSMPLQTGLQIETTSGFLFVHGLSLHLTLTEYRHREAKPDTISGPNRYYPDKTGLSERDITFVPESALRPASYRQSGLFGQSDTATLVIDYDLLSKLPAPTAQATSSAAPSTVKTERNNDRPSPATEPGGSGSASEKTGARDEDMQSLKNLVIKKDMELEALKEELRTLRRQLGEREAQSDPPKRKKSSPRTQDSAP